MTNVKLTPLVANKRTINKYTLIWDIAPSSSNLKHKTEVIAENEYIAYQCLQNQFPDFDIDIWTEDVEYGYDH